MKHIRLIEPPPRIDFMYPAHRLTISTLKFAAWSYDSWWHDADIRLLDKFGIKYQIIQGERRLLGERRGN